MSDYFIGIMSGTSLDGIDAVLTKISPEGQVTVLHHVEQSFDNTLKNNYLSLQQPGHNELHTEALAANQLAKQYAVCAQKALTLANLKPQDIIAIGAHGQTIRHQPENGYTLQSLNPALLAELTGVDVIADFRSRDVAADGQGAPLVPAFHAHQFGDHKNLAVLNIGGISNLSLIPSNTNQPVLGFDCGPGNVLMDGWIHRHQQKNFDAQGQWARSGKVVPELLESFLSEPFFSKPPPKSSGRDLFNLDWVDAHLTPKFTQALPADIQATLLQLTAQSIVNDLKRYGPNIERLIVCGGGSQNTFLIETLHVLSKAIGDLEISFSNEYGLNTQTVEAAAFAWLAWRYKNKQPANLPAVTGAKGPRILGALYPA